MKNKLLMLLVVGFIASCGVNPLFSKSVTYEQQCKQGAQECSCDCGCDCGCAMQRSLAPCTLVSKSVSCEQQCKQGSCCNCNCGCGCEEGTRKSLAPCDKNEVVPNLENSPLYAAIIAADDVFELTYVPQPDLFAPRKAAIVTCMDYRLNDFLSTVTSGTYILRNAGGRVTDDWIRSLVILYKLLGVEEIFLIQHTDCGMQKFTDKVMKDLLEGSLVAATMVKNCNVTLEPVQDNDKCKWKNTSKCCGTESCMNWLTINHGLFDSVLEDVTKLRRNCLIPSNIPIYGFIFDVITGDLIPVPKAMREGRAKPLYCK